MIRSAADIITELMGGAVDTAGTGVYCSRMSTTVRVKVDAVLWKQVRVAAAQSDQTREAWVAEAIRRRLKERK